MTDPDREKSTRLFLLLGAFFVTNVLVAEFIGVKIFSLERTLGKEPLALRTLVEEPLSFNLTAGVLLWPFVFVMTDLVNEYWGVRGVRRLSLIAIGMIAYAFVMVLGAVELAPADFWLARDLGDGRALDMQLAFEQVFGQGLWIIAGSIAAFSIGQLVDVSVFHWLKKRSGEKWIWLRATGSTLVSQLIDSFVVLYVAFGLGPAHWELALILSICLVNYLFKFTAALAMTPVLYLVHGVIERYLGKELASSMKRAAMDGR